MYFLNPTSQLTTSDVRQAVRNLVIDAGLNEIQARGIPDSAHDLEDTTGKLAHDADVLFDAWASSIISSARQHLANHLTETFDRAKETNMDLAAKSYTAYKECVAREETALECDNQELAADARGDATQAWGKHRWSKGFWCCCETLTNNALPNKLETIPTLAELESPSSEPEEVEGAE
ncbi:MULTISPECIES: hypothetical protein [Actinomycetaceae]|uniref:hypothetical protein n=1 Tax=Actinomycetaceae TaxID=2049 RepID=UPI00242D03DD|nr:MULTISPECIES: hypothetical protein [Actinotignum]MDK6372585.1 hypothetical protein [Actinotignum timonense]MDK6788074.1 hypothetical protein [Actinotignum timonense]MDK8357675.1 hypothetical protein [Actinotignum timonense]